MSKNKKIIWLFFLALILLFPAAAGRAFAVDEKACSQRMGEIATLLELWRVDHGAYPTAAEFSSRDFQAYGALGQNPVKHTCPDNEKPYIYAPNPTRSDYTLSCPDPQVHGLPKLIRTSSEEIAGETELTHSDRQAMVDVIRNLHRAYSKKNLKEVLLIIKKPIENSAKLLHERKGIPEDTVADAFRGGIEDIFNAEKFRMKPLNLKKLTYWRRGDLCEVRSFKPVIESERVIIGSGSESFRVNIKLSQFVFRKGDSGWELIKMDMM
ncbi:MAG: hypothetical protein V2A78_12220 [bacterium]